MHPRFNKLNLPNCRILVLLLETTDNRNQKKLKIVTCRNSLSIDSEGSSAGTKVLGTANTAES